MITVWGIIIVAALIALIDVPHLLRKRMKRELWAFSLLLLIGTGLCIAFSMQLQFPNPLAGLVFIYKPFSDFIFHLLA